MSRVWRRLQRVGKTAYKFEFTIKVHTVTLECVAGWTPNQVSILWVRRGRRVRTEATSWTTLPGKDTQGVVHWQALEAVITLYLDKSGSKFEEKFWTLVVENVGLNGKHKALATKRINMAEFVHPKDKRTELRQKYQMKSVARKVHVAEVQVTFLSQFEKKGPATDEDMRSISSEMSELTYNNFDDGYMSETEGENDLFNKPSNEENEKIMREIAAIGQNFQELTKCSDDPMIFKVNGASHSSQETELIDWCKLHTKRHPRVNIVDLKDSWRDGYGFCAIIHTFRPDILNLENCGDPFTNAKLAIIAAAKLGIAPSIDPIDFQSGDLDKLSIITFIHQLHQQFLHDTPTFNPVLGYDGAGDMTTLQRQLQRSLSLNNEDCNGSYDRQSSDTSRISHRILKQSPQHRRRAATVVTKRSDLGDVDEERRRREMIERGRLRLSKRKNKNQGTGPRQVISTSSGASNSSLNDSRSPVRSPSPLKSPPILEENPVIYTRAMVHSSSLDRSPVKSKESSSHSIQSLGKVSCDVSLMDAVLNSIMTEPEHTITNEVAELDVFDELVNVHSSPEEPPVSPKSCIKESPKSSIGGSSEIMREERRLNSSNSSSRLYEASDEVEFQSIGLDTDEMFKEFGLGEEKKKEDILFTKLEKEEILFKLEEEDNSPISCDEILNSLQLQPSNDLVKSVEEISRSAEELNKEDLDTSKESINVPSEILISEIKTDSMPSLDNEELTLKMSETESNIAAAKEAVLSPDYYGEESDKEISPLVGDVLVEEVTESLSEEESAGVEFKEVPVKESKAIEEVLFKEPKAAEEVLSKPVIVDIIVTGEKHPVTESRCKSPIPSPARSPIPSPARSPIPSPARSPIPSPAKSSRNFENQIQAEIDALEADLNSTSLFSRELPQKVNDPSVSCEAEPLLEPTPPPTPPTMTRNRPSLRDRIRGLHDARQKLMKATSDVGLTSKHSSSSSLDKCDVPAVPAVPRGRLPNSSSSQGSSTCSIPDKLAAERPKPAVAPKSFDRKLSQEKIALLRASPTTPIDSPTLREDPLQGVIETSASNKQSSNKMLSLSELISSFNTPAESVPPTEPKRSEALPTSAEITCPSREVEDDVMEGEDSTHSPDSGLGSYLPEQRASSVASIAVKGSTSSDHSSAPHHSSLPLLPDSYRQGSTDLLSQPPPPPPPEPLLMMMGPEENESEGDPEELQQDLKDVRDYITECHDRISTLQIKLDNKAKILEKELREAMDTQNANLEQELLKSWLLSVNERNMLVRKQDALNYLQADEDLEERCCQVVMEKRKYDSMKDLDKSVDDYEREAQLECEYEALMKKRETLLRIREEINSISVEEEAEFQSVLNQPRLLQDQSNCRVS